MSIRLRCPNGHRIVAEDADAGLSVRCGECELHVRVPASLPADPPVDTAIRSDAGIPSMSAAKEEDYDERPRRRRRKLPRVDAGSHPYGRVRIGLALHYAWLLVYLISFALAILAIVTSVDARSNLARMLAVLNLLVALAMFFVKPILGILGSAFCLRVPSGSGARPYIWTSLALDLAALAAGVLVVALGALGAFSTMTQRGSEGAATTLLALAFIGINYLCNYLAWVFLMIILHKFCVYVNDYGGASEAAPVGALGSILLLSPGVYAMLMILLGALLGPDVALAMFCVGFLLLVAWVVAAMKVFLRNLAILSDLRAHLLKQMEALK